MQMFEQLGILTWQQYVVMGFRFASGILAIVLGVLIPDLFISILCVLLGSFVIYFTGCMVAIEAYINRGEAILKYDASRQDHS